MRKDKSTLSYEQAIEELKQLWVEFNELAPTYEKLISIKRKLSISLNPLAPIFIKEEFPDIEFLKLESLEAAVDYIYDLNLIKMRTLLKEIYFQKEQGVFYSAMKKWIKCSISEIRNYGSPKKYHYDKAEVAKKRQYAAMLLAQINC